MLRADVPLWLEFRTGDKVGLPLLIILKGRQSEKQRNPETWDHRSRTGPSVTESQVHDGQVEMEYPVVGIAWGLPSWAQRSPVS